MATAATITKYDGYADSDVLVTPMWLQARLGDPQVRVVELDVSRAAFDAGHIEGAVLWNVYGDLKDSGYRLVGREALEGLLARSGIAPGSTVVFYGYAPAMGLWLMKLLGHADARILDCARGTWRDEGRPWTASPAVPAPTRYRLDVEDPRIRAGHRRVESAIGDPSVTLLDVRSPEEFRGERFWPSGGSEPGGRAGHVPSAVNFVIPEILDERGAFRSAEDLRRLLSPVDLCGDRELITYCTIGGRASTAWFVLTHLLGREGVRVYDGSWAEWGKLPEAPVTTD
jgi:thiosulfate/3-mercaptopyruvate sulfurtransferase